MIRVNLLAAERKDVKKKAASPLQITQKVTLGCTLILVAAGGTIGWRFMSLRRESAALDASIATAQQETARLHSIIQQVQQFEQRRAQLQQRVALIEQLRRDQTGPVHMLDQISRALPPMLWLTDLKQGADPNEVLIDGKCPTLTSLSDFVANLENSGYFRKSIEIVNSEAEGAPTALVKFSIRAQFQRPGAPAEATRPKRAAGAAADAPAAAGGKS
jgi:type IV pilus assembly protein PilN